MLTDGTQPTCEGVLTPPQNREGEEPVPADGTTRSLRYDRSVTPPNRSPAAI